MNNLAVIDAGIPSSIHLMEMLRRRGDLVVLDDCSPEKQLNKLLTEIKKERPVPMSKRPSRMVHHFHNGGAPIVNKRFPDRNDACPCGSGKKWKKCGLINPHKCPKCGIDMSLYRKGDVFSYQCDNKVCPETPAPKFNSKGTETGRVVAYKGIAEVSPKFNDATVDPSWIPDVKPRAIIGTEGGETCNRNGCDGIITPDCDPCNTAEGRLVCNKCGAEI